ncbi:GNAT family N-acetyltransferase [Salinactinospora qingdaonensis]|uniref:GNAT family N-acetyltransferase n=1 Tax=Salinactinospora qingdaonensis TaxID=702744 RepID=A0ABP7GF72_9ACTN
MTQGPVIDTPRLLMRRWCSADRKPFAAMNADPVVMEYFPATQTRAASDAAIDRFERGFERDGFGLWALQRRDTGAFIGFTGLKRVEFTAAFTPAVEVGWRLYSQAWGQGYASEAARAAVRFGFTSAGLDEIVSLTAVTNERSRRVMRRLGMTHDPADDFRHPSIEPDHPLAPHVLYRLSRSRWRESLVASPPAAP